VHKYDIALSFAGEDREYVETVARCLLFYKVRVFYDEFERADLWGKDLYTHLGQIYERTAKYVVIFVSEHYRNKLWTKHELKSAQARALVEAEEYILPARFDDTELPGLLHTTHYVDLRKINAAGFAALIVEKIKANLDEIATVERLTLPNFVFTMTDEHVRSFSRNHGPKYNRHTLELLFRPSKDLLEVDLQKATCQYPKDVLDLTFIFAEQRHQYVYTMPEQLLFGLIQRLKLHWIYQTLIGRATVPQWLINGRSLVEFIPPLNYLDWIPHEFVLAPLQHQTPRSGTNDPSNSMAISFNLIQP